MNIAIITARGGSKRIPRKNVKPFLGKPMITWPIEAAKMSGCFEHIIVSTDDEEIADISRLYGAEVPILRPGELADDYTPAHEAAQHMLDWALNAYGAIKIFCHIYPTAPLLSAETLRESIRKIQEENFNSSWAMVRIPYPVYQIMILNENGGLQRLFPADKVNLRSQDMPPAFIDVGQSYAFGVEHFLKYGMRLGDDVAVVEVPAETAIDIDTEEDWVRAEEAARLLFSRP